MVEGRVIKAYNSFFYVMTEAGLVSCKLRGKFKKRRQSTGVVPGDRVAIELLPDGTGVIEQQLPRVNLLRRPAVANLTQVILTFAAAAPDLHPLLLNRFLVLAEWSGIPKIVICVNKMDLHEGPWQDFLRDYEAIGYPVVRVSAQTGQGIDVLRSRLRGEVSVFAGPSGVGKSSLLNQVNPALTLATGHVSEKIKRGRHTTRHVELFALPNGGYVADTPGFGSFDIEQMESIRPAELQYCFPEFEPYLGACRFTDCTHRNEPDCAVNAAADEGAIHPSRLDSYRRLWEQANRKKDWEVRQTE